MVAKTDELKVMNKVKLNHKRNKAQDNTAAMDSLAEAFDYEQAKAEYWNPECFSLLYGTALWEQASENERRILNHLYWVAYYSQIISAEIATIFFNQTCAASLYTVEGFRSVCDMLDLESSQERAHINAFSQVSRNTELHLFGRPIFSYPVRSPYANTMVYSNNNWIKSMVRKFLLKYFALLSSSNVFIGCQYFTIRAIRTLNGKLVQHKLSQYYSKHPDKDLAPAPAEISYHHFCDESYHFNSSMILSKDVVRCLPKPSNFEKMVMHQGLIGCQRDHQYFSTTVNGIFWYEPALFDKIYEILKSPLFQLSHADIKDLMWKCYAEESEGSHLAQQTHQLAISSYEAYLEDLEYIKPEYRSMTIMKSTTLDQYHKINRLALEQFFINKERQNGQV